VEAYASAEPGQPAGIIGSEERLEIFVRDGSAAAVLALGRGAAVRARPA
jgi:S-adenosylmethionine hydrolase